MDTLVGSDNDKENVKDKLTSRRTHHRRRLKGELIVGGGLETAETERTRKMGATWAATQVGLRGVKVGLGGHDAGVSGDDEGVRDRQIQISKRGRVVWSDHPTFSGFVLV